MQDPQTLILGAGCFWCLDAVYKQCPGVKLATSGYAGGETDDPTYNEVCGGDTGHAEVVKIDYDSLIIGQNQLLEIFFAMHDPTSLNRQGNDFGPQYRSIVCYQDQQQKQTIEASIEEHQKNLQAPIVTQVTELIKFYPAESVHQDYYQRNSAHGYYQIMIKPKLDKLHQMML